MSFRYKKRSKRTPRMNIDRLPPPRVGDDPPLTGWVNGLEASDLEERFARALKTENYDFSFQKYIPTAFSLPREDKVVDFIVWDLMMPVEVDGEIGHKTAAQQAKDDVRDAHMNPELHKTGLRSITHVKWHELEDQALANLVARELI